MAKLEGGYHSQKNAYHRVGTATYQRTLRTSRCTVTQQRATTRQWAKAVKLAEREVPLEEIQGRVLRSLVANWYVDAALAADREVSPEFGGW